VIAPLQALGLSVMSRAASSGTPLLGEMLSRLLGTSDWVPTGLCNGVSFTAAASRTLAEDCWELSRLCVSDPLQRAIRGLPGGLDHHLWKWEMPDSDLNVLSN
jgi:hypothetical protein